MKTVIFENDSYISREVFLPEFGDVVISTISLNEKLMNETGGYKSLEAESLDEEIFYFVEDSQIGLPEAELVAIISKDLR